MRNIKIAMKKGISGLTAFWGIIIPLWFGSCQQFADNETAPSKPLPTLEITVIPADSQVTVFWDAVEGNPLYTVWLDGELIGETSVTMKVIGGLINGQTYFVQVGTRINGKQVLSKLEPGIPFMPMVPPEPPVLRVMADDQSLKLSWSPVVGAQSYPVYLDGVIVDEVTASQMEITGLVNDFEYSVQVQAKNSAGVSLLSNLALKKPTDDFKKTPIGFAVDVFSTETAFAPSPLLKIDMLRQADAIDIMDDTGSFWNLIVDETTKGIARGQSQSNRMGGSMSFEGVTFTAGFSNGFSKTNSENIQTFYCKLEAAHRRKRVGLVPWLRDPYELVKYLSDGAQNAFDNDMAREIVRKYGWGLVTEHYIGGRMDCYITIFTSNKESLQQVRSSVNADISFLGNLYGASVRHDDSSSTAISEWRKNSDIRFSSDNGNLSKALSIEEVFINYPSWVESLENNAGFSGIVSMIPIWDMAAAYGKRDLARELKAEYIRQALTKIDQLETLFPNQWMSMEERIYGPGTAVFNFPEKFITDAEGTKYPVTVTYRIFLWGAASGSNGSATWGNSGHLGGGAGTPGALLKIVIKTIEGLRAVISCGNGGAGGGTGHGHRWLGSGAHAGEDSSIIILGQTFIVGGGNPSGFSDDRYWPASGGIGSPLYPPGFVEDYVIANGGSTSGAWNQPGVPGKIDNFSAPSAPVGNNSGYGYSGAGGGIRIQSFYYED